MKECAYYVLLENIENDHRTHILSLKSVKLRNCKLATLSAERKCL